MASQTEVEYNIIISQCADIFEKKNKDYGTAWRILRLPSITDQIYIKALRIRSIQIKGTQKVQEDINGEFIGMINYCIMALIQIGMTESNELEIPVERLMSMYQEATKQTYDLLTAKNHDYGEAWRDMRVTSITDIILMKLLRIKQIEDNQGKTIISEGIDANYQDIINYSVFALILLKNNIKK